MAEPTEIRAIGIDSNGRSIPGSCFSESAEGRQRAEKLGQKKQERKTTDGFHFSALIFLPALSEKRRTLARLTSKPLGFSATWGRMAQPTEIRSIDTDDSIGRSFSGSRFSESAVSENGK